MERLSRISVFFCFLACFAAERSSAAKFIVRLKNQSNGTLNILSRGLVMHQKISAVAKQLSEGSGFKTQALHNAHAIVTEAANIEAVKNQLSGNEDVAYIEEDKVVKLAEAPECLSGQACNFGARPAQSPYLNVLGLSNPNPSYTDTFVPSSPSDSPILIAVVDTGINLNHPFLKPFLSVNKGETGLDANGHDKATNGIDDDGDGYVDDVYGASAIDGNGNVSDVQDHGTHVAGLIKTVRDQAIAAGYDEAKKIQVLPIRFFYPCGDDICGTTAGAIAALDYALARGAKVVNMSWGSQGGGSYSQALNDTLVDMYENNITLVAAAGNSAENTDSVPFFPSSLSACIPGLISVNSITTWHDPSNGSLEEISLSSFSNYAENSVDVAAPGSSVFTFTGMLSSNGFYPSSSSKFVAKSGTSMASPIVAGIAGVMRALNPSLTAHDIKNLIVSNARVPRDSGNNKILANMNRAEGYAHAIDSFEAAKVATSLNANVVGSCSVSYAEYEDSSSGGGKGGGCGALLSGPGVDNGGNNPFGGNSIGLFASLFFFVQIVRRMSYKIRQC